MDTAVGKMRQVIVSILGTLSVLVVGIFDYLTGWQMSFSIFYSVPILTATWYGSLRIGIFLSIASMGVGLASDVLMGADYAYSWIPYWNNIVRFSFFIALSWMLHKNKTRLAYERKTARTDVLTGAYNSRAFFEIAEAELERCRRYGHPFTLIYIDVDDFKSINDTGGHDIGDNVLKNVVQTIKKGTRRTDIVARLGGDEFAVLFIETNLAQAEVVAANLHRHMTEKMRECGRAVTFSVGAIAYDGKRPKSLQEIITMADRLMYESKKQGKNRVSVKSSASM